MPLTKVASSMLASGASGSGGSTGKNYISSYNNGTCNGDFESGSISGWSVCSVTGITNGVPTSAPTIISSPTASNPALTLLSSGQLAGQYSLQAVFPTTSIREGFISDIFTIDSEDQAKVLTFKFYYNVTSGAANGNFSGTSSNTFIVAVYAVNGTNAGWVQPAGLYAMTQSSGGAGIATGTFQTYSDTTQYRFAILCAVAPTPASITVAFDDFQVGPLTAPIGAPVSDWQSYTPTFTNLGTITPQTFWWRRVGDSVQIKGRFSCTVTGSASEARVSLPSGLVSSDSTKINGTLEVAGVAKYNSVSATFFGGYSVLIEPSVAYMTFGAETSTLAPLPVTKLNGNQLITAGGSLSLFAQIPIQGWSSNVQMSNDTDTRVVDFVGNKTSTQATTSLVTNITLSTLKDTHGAWNNDTYTVPVSGDYVVSGCLTTTTGTSATYVYVDTVQTALLQQYISSAATTGTAMLPNLRAGQTITLRQFWSTGGTIAAGATDQRIHIFRLSGPSVIAATETVACEYITTAGNTINNTTDTFIDFGTRQGDTHLSVVGAGSGNNTTATNTWRFVAPISGRYLVSASVSFNMTVSAGYDAYIRIARDGVDYQDGTRVSGTMASATPLTLVATGEIQLNAGQYISIKTYQNSGSARTMNTVGNRVSIVRVGN